MSCPTALRNSAALAANSDANACTQMNNGNKQKAQLSVSIVNEDDVNNLRGQNGTKTSNDTYGTLLMDRQITFAKRAGQCNALRVDMSNSANHPLT